MFKNLTVYALTGAPVPPLNALEDKLEALPFRPCGPTEPASWGFVAPSLAENAELVERLGGGRIVLAVRRQVRQVPGDALRKKVDELAKAFEQETGRKAGAKRRRELKEEALLELLPQAFTKDTTALERARALGTIPESKVVAVVAQSLGVCESLVVEAMAVEDVV